ncbi:MAG: hypothetical protein EOS78_26860 [Mesorhizobium sp.]|nr:MAG: hypothetical protein EOS78_26860 [Mesorhizobium sp.]
MLLEPSPRRENAAAPTNSPEVLIGRGTLGLSNGSILVDFQGRATTVSAFEFVYFSGLTANDLLGGVVSLLACCVLYNVIAEDRPHR